MTSKTVFRCFLLVFLFAFVGMLIFGVAMFSTGDSYSSMDGVSMLDEDEEVHLALDTELDNENMEDGIDKPIILWWTKFTGEPGRYKKCGDVKCFFTAKKVYKDHAMTRVFVYYGTDFKLTDLPIPRKPNHEWALLHEESPKNNFLFSHSEIMTLFNYSSTFKRESNYPITTQYLVGIEWLEKKDYMVSTSEKNKLQQELAPLFYAHSDCDTPSDRDHYVQMLQKFMKVDSYGKCVHNKDLPSHLVDPIQGMEHADFYKLQAKYKFSLAMENGICDDYVTEKLWRPLMLGSVPVVMGSPKVWDFLPDNHSAIIVDDFGSVKELADYLDYLNKHDEEYEKYLNWKKMGVTNKYLQEIMKKREWSVLLDNEEYVPHVNFIDGFECYMCKAVHENLNRREKGEKSHEHKVTNDHYGCPAPKHYNTEGKRVTKKNNFWTSDWHSTGRIAKVARKFIDKNRPFTMSEVHEDIHGML